MTDERTIAELSLVFTGAFESELLTELMLRHWSHPLADEVDFRNHLLESAAEILGESVTGVRFIADLGPEHMNLVAALWLAESAMLENVGSLSIDQRADRETWLATVRRALPSCFCDPELLL